MCRISEFLIEKIVKSCFSLYGRLPKTGKPIEKEWTVLSCIVQYDSTTENTEVVSLGTGSKCIGATKMSALGDVLNDSHAEVFARRGFLLYLYDNIEKALQNKKSIFTQENGKFKLKDYIEFIFYSSQLPCGDACIITKSGQEEHFGDIIQQNKHPAEHDTSVTGNKRQKLDDDIYRTGAKCLPHCEQDTQQSGKNYHLIGQVRTKPGRGDRTLSVSCSDKIAKWIHLGIQGSLLDMLLCDTIHIKHFIFGAGVPYSEESLNRALLNREPHCLSRNVQPKVVPCFYQSSLSFVHIKKDDTMRPAPGSIVWINITSQLHEVAVQGKKLGTTKKKMNILSSSLCISKYNLFKRFQDILQKDMKLKRAVIGEDSIESLCYNDMKKKSKRYSQNWSQVKEYFFKTWSVKPDIFNFCVNIT